MHVLIVNQYALPAGAAGITRHGDLGVELVRRGHDVTVLASGFNYLTRARGKRRSGPEIIGGVDFRWLDTGAYLENDSRRVRSMVTFALRAILAGVAFRRRPDVVIGSSPQLLAGIAAWVIARRHRRPFVFEVRDPWPSALVDLGAIRSGGLTHRLLERIERFLYRHADRIITVMEHADRRVNEVGEDPTKCVHIPNASSVPATDEALPASLATLLDEESSAGRVVIMYTGAHGLSNGLGEVLDALNSLRSLDLEAYDRVALVFIGAGPAKEDLRAQSVRDGHEHTHFHDPMPKSVLFSAMRRADYLLVHFARADFKRFGMSANKLFDAMAAAKPVLLATPLTDTPVDAVRCGLRYEPGDPEALADALGAAVRTPDEQRRAMGERGKREMRRRYSLDVTGKQLEELLGEIIAER